MILGILMIGIQGVLFTSELGQLQSAIQNNESVIQEINIQMRNTQV